MAAAALIHLVERMITQELADAAPPSRQPVVDVLTHAMLGMLYPGLLGSPPSRQVRGPGSAPLPGADMDLSTLPRRSLLRWDPAVRVALAIGVPLAIGAARTGTSVGFLPAVVAVLVTLSNLGPDMGDQRRWSAFAAVLTPVGAIGGVLAAHAWLPLRLGYVFVLYAILGVFLLAGLLTQLAMAPVAAAAAVRHRAVRGRPTHVAAGPHRPGRRDLGLPAHPRHRPDPVPPPSDPRWGPVAAHDDPAPDVHPDPPCTTGATRCSSGRCRHWCSSSRRP